MGGSVWRSTAEENRGGRWVGLRVVGMKSSFLCGLSLLLAVTAMSAASEADELFDGLRFSDGVTRSSADFAGQNVLIYFFCGH